MSSSLLSAGFLVNPDIDGVDKPACRDREAAPDPPQGESSSQIEDTSGAVHSDDVSAFCREVAALRLLLLNRTMKQGRESQSTPKVG